MSVILSENAQAKYLKYVLYYAFFYSGMFWNMWKQNCGFYAIQKILFKSFIDVGRTYFMLCHNDILDAADM